MARLKYWVWLSTIGGVRPLTKYRLAGAMGGPEAIFFADRDELLAAGATEAEAKRLSDKSMMMTERALSVCEDRGIGILTIQDATYPERLRSIADPPVTLYVWGRLPPVDELAFIAIVGTRRATPYGVRSAARLGADVARGGGVVVSGLAEGCDAAAMEAAIRSGGTVVGVLGTAIDGVYPKSNAALFNEVRAHGALVSEYPPGMRTFASDFRVRNRIITGLSLGVAVAEAPIRSGTRVTVNHALEQGRDVFAVPGNIDGPAAEGTNDLIASGAIPVTSGMAILAEYSHRTDLNRREPAASAPTRPVSAPPRPNAGPTRPSAARTPIKKEIDNQKDIVYIDLAEKLAELPEPQRRVMQALTAPDMHADELIEASGLSAAEANAALTMLQLSGCVTQGPGRRYSRGKQFGGA